jgi:hypothetical protein
MKAYKLILEYITYKKQNIWIAISISFLLIILVATGCSKSVFGRQITITAKNEIFHKILIAEGQSFKELFIEYISKGEVREVKIGDEIQIDFGKSDPDYLVISEWLLSENGDIIYTDRIVGNHEYYHTGNGLYHFVVNEDLLAIIDSHKNDVKGVYRGFRIDARWEFERESYIMVCKLP